MNTREISFIVGDEGDTQRDGDRRYEQVETARLRVSAGGSNRGAQCTVNPRSAGIERNRIKGLGDPVVAPLAGDVEELTSSRPASAWACGHAPSLG
ncbi:MAG: hypothetical protein ACLP5J_13270 [Mycobacterium sp.]|uniref:hypothetical protein n=1 Tax=Mycobacterium sp. TaxID=1785 RepID=UPI003F9493DA